MFLSLYLIKFRSMGFPVVCTDEQKNEILIFSFAEFHSKRESKMKKILKILDRAKHPNIQKIYAAYFWEKRLFLALEHFPLASLWDLSKSNFKVEEKEVALISKSILSALSFLHSHHIIHRGITSQTIYLTQDGNVKLTSFFHATMTTKENPKKQALVGNPHFLPPVNSPDFCL